MEILKNPAFFQGGYYILSGIWPLIHINSFLAVTGPKIDLWLVKMVGLLVIVIGSTLLFPCFARKGRMSTETPILAIMAALGFIFIEVYYVFAGRIWDIYLADALVELLLIFWWAWYLKNYPVCTINTM